MSGTQLVICGSIAIDRIMNFDGNYKDVIQADKIHVLSLSMLLDKLEDTPGGIAANITANLAQLGDKPVLLGSVGRDATPYVEELAGLGVDTSRVHFSDLPTASFNVITDSEDNQVGGFYPGAMLDSKALSFKPWQGKDAIVMISAHDPEGMNRQVEEAKGLNLRLVYDPGQQASNPATDLAAGIEAAEMVFANDYELGVICQKLDITAEELKAKVPVMITTFGKAGSIIEGTKVKDPVKIGVAKPDKVADPTGAGDAYRAGFMYGYLRQWELAKCGELGATVASLVVEKHGTQVRFTPPDVTRRYQANFGGEIEL